MKEKISVKPVKEESILEQAEKARNDPAKFASLHTYYHGTLKPGDVCPLCP